MRSIIIIKTKHKKLSQREVFIGLMDYGLFAEKLPPCFTSKGLSSAIERSLLNLFDLPDENKLKKKIDNCCHDYIRYESLRDINIPRRMGIPHPESYFIQALAIKKYWDEISRHCDMPTPRTSRIYVRRVGGGRIFEMNYKGFDHFEIEEEELQWTSGAQFILKTDISTCFPSIYTHSIPWALHGQDVSKKNRGILQLSGNILDKCTQNIRDGQTNGLLIGPHSSNIISETILTQIDSKLISKGYRRFKRHIDDYEFYATTYQEAEHFLHDLGLFLREYELAINEKKTKILPLPKSIMEHWINEINRFSFKNIKEVEYSTVRSFLDLALELSQSSGTSAPLNYAIKMMPKKLNKRAKRLYVQEAINLALHYPYLTHYLAEHVFDKYPHRGLKEKVTLFVNNLMSLGIHRLYPDAITHGLYYAIRYNTVIDLGECKFQEIIEFDDCIVNVLLLEYAKRRGISKIESLIKKRSSSLKKCDSRERDQQWLLIYQTWTESELNGNGQSFLGNLKRKNFEFLKFL